MSNPIRDYVSAPQIDELIAKYGDRLQLMPSLHKVQAIAILGSALYTQRLNADYRVTDEIQQRLGRGEPVSIYLQEWLNTMDGLSPKQINAVVLAIASYLSAEHGFWKEI